MGDQGEIRICTLQRGFVYVGYLRREEHEMVLRNARCIRRWGTSKGLGELHSGPKTSTILDNAGTVRFHPLQMICSHDVDQKAWAKVLK